MKNILRKSLFVFILLIFSVATLSLADEKEESTTTQNNYFYAGSNDVTINSPVEGDAFIFTSGLVTINSNITGNAFICASSVNISELAVIQASLFNVSESLVLNGDIGLNVYNVSNNFTLNGSIDTDLFSASRQNNLNGAILGNANISSENISISDSSSIGKDLNYSSKNKIDIPNDVVKGLTNYNFVDVDKEYTSNKTIDFIESALSLIILAIVVFILCRWLNCKVLNSSTNDFIKNLPKYLLYGLLGLIVIPVLCILLLICGITINLAFILLAMYFVLMLLASSIVIIVLSKLIAEKLNTKFDKVNKTLLTILSIIVLSIIYKLLQLIPILEMAITFLFVIVGIGIFIKNIIPAKTSENQ